MLAPWKKSYDQPRKYIKKQRHYFADKGLCSQSYGLTSSHLWMWELDHNKGWALKDWCFWTVVLEKTLESPLDCKEIQSVHPKGNQLWTFIGRTDAEAPILWPSDLKNWPKSLWSWERLKAGGEWGRQRTGWLDGISDERPWVWASSGDGEGQGVLACCGHGVTESRTQLRLNNEQNV